MLFQGSKYASPRRRFLEEKRRFVFRRSLEHSEITASWSADSVYRILYYQLDAHRGREVHDNVSL